MHRFSTASSALTIIPYTGPHASSTSRPKAPTKPPRQPPTTFSNTSEVDIPCEPLDELDDKSGQPQQHPATVENDGLAESTGALQPDTSQGSQGELLLLQARID